MNDLIRLLAMDLPREARDVLSARFNAHDLAYHNIDHIMHMLCEFEAHYVDALTLSEALLIKQAIWFHDIVYVPRAKDNERKSVEVALRVLKPSKADSMTLEHLIMATAGSHDFHTALEEILVDLDLAILAVPRDEYARYARKIREEFSMFSEDEYRAGRINVLDQLCIPDMLRTLSVAKQLGRDELRDCARENMRWEQDRLRSNQPILQALTSI